MKTIDAENRRYIHQQLSLLECPKKTIKGTGVMFNVKNNLMGQLFIAMLRKSLNRSSYKIWVRGSLADRVSLRKQGVWVSSQSVDLTLADRYRIYIYQKENATEWYMDRVSSYERTITGLNNQIDKLKSITISDEPIASVETQRYESGNKDPERLLGAQRQTSTPKEDELQKQVMDLEYKLNRIKLTLETIGYSI